LTCKTEQFYIRRIAKLEKQVAELVEINETFVKKNAELAEQVAKLTDKVAKLSKNSSYNTFTAWLRWIAVAKT
jgi:cell division protein FtsB